MIDALFVGLYGLFLLTAAAVFRKQDRPEDYLLASRRVTLPVFVASLVSTWYGGILGVGEYSYRHGLSNWLVFGVPYYLAAFLFAVFIASRARRTAYFTIPDQLLKAYGSAPAYVGSVILFVMTAPAAYVLQLGILLNLLFGWPLLACLVVSTTFSVTYVLRGGLKGDLITDVIQFALMFCGFGLLVGYAMRQGGTAFLTARLPASHFQWHGGKSPWYVVSWYFIALSTLVEPAFYQRCYAARDERVARRGILVSILFWMVFDGLTTTAGLYARALLSDLANPLAAFPTLAKALLPQWARGVFWVALLAVVMSTVDSYLFLGGITLGRDILWRWRGREEAQVNRYTRLALVATAAVAILVAMWLRSVVDIWHHFGSVGTPALLLPLATSFSRRLRPDGRTALLMMVGAGAVSALWLAWSYLPWGNGSYPWGLEPIFPGLAVSLGLLLAGRRRSGSRLSAGLLEGS